MKSRGCDAYRHVREYSIFLQLIKELPNKIHNQQEYPAKLGMTYEEFLRLKAGLFACQRSTNKSALIQTEAVQEDLPIWVRDRGSTVEMSLAEDWVPTLLGALDYTLSHLDDVDLAARLAYTRHDITTMLTKLR